MERAIYTHRTQTDQFDFIDNRFHGVLSKEVSRQVVSVLEGGHLGMATGTLLSNPEALTAEARRLCGFSRRVDYGFPKTGSSSQEPKNPGISQIPHSEIVDLCQSVVDTLLKRYPDVTVDVIARRTRSEVDYDNSHGVRHHGEEWTLSYVVVVQRSSEEDLFTDYAAFDHALHQDEERLVLERYVERLGRCFPVVEISGGEYPALILAQTLEQFLNGFWQALDGKRLYEKQSPLADRFGERLLDERFSLAIDPLALGDGNFDFEGVAARYLPLIERGVLTDGFFDLEYAQKCGRPESGLATGNLRDRFRNEPLRIPFGDRNADALLASAGRGILVQHCGEVARTTNLKGDFSCGLDALYFEGGEIKGRIKSLNMSGNVFELLRDGLAELSCEGERSPTLGVIAPHLLFKAVRFAV
jgi:PmbA protein